MNKTFPAIGAMSLIFGLEQFLLALSHCITTIMSSKNKIIICPFNVSNVLKIKLASDRPRNY
jgi:hypothetical protein